MTPDDDALRLNRFLARAGFGSRRSVETLIADGRVRIDGEVAGSPGCRVAPGSRVTVDGKDAAWPTAWRVLAHHKTLGVVTSLRQQGRAPCLAGVAAAAGFGPGLVPVGRLDADTTGLLIWTDDGDLAQALLRPRRQVWKRYEVRLAAALPPSARPRLADGGIMLDGHPCLPARLHPPGRDPRRWILEIQEGRNRQVRRMFGAVGATVLGLHRTAIGPVTLGDLAPGKFRELTTGEIAALRAAADSGP